MKKLLAFLIAAMLVFSLTACGGEDDPENKKPNDGIELPIVDVPF